MTAFEISPYRQPLKIPYRWSKGTHMTRAGLILRLDLGNGAVGWGEAAPPPHEEVTLDSFAADCAALIEGLDPEAPDFLAQLDARGAEGRLRCGISTAWHSAMAAAAGQTLARYVGGANRRIPAAVPVNELITDATPEGCVESSGAALANGQTTVKVKCTNDRELDIARVGAIREAFPDITIRIDPNESWPLDWAAEQLRAMSRFDIEYCEEPLVRGSGLEAYRELRKAQPVPIALDDSLRSPDHLEEIIANEATDFLVLKAQRVGGPDIARNIMDRAAEAGIVTTVTASLETAVGLHLAVHVAALAETPTPSGIGTARFFAEDVAAPPPIVDGAMKVPDTPGLGVSADAWWRDHEVIPAA